MENLKTDFDTVYKKSYKGLPTVRVAKSTFAPDYPDIISGPFTDYVKPRSVYDNMEDVSELEEPTKCHERLMKSYPVLAHHMDSEPDHGVVERHYRDSARTVYQLEICNMVNGITSKKTLARRRVQLPADWGEVPRTTQRAGYRDIRRLATWDLQPKPAVPPKPFLDANMKERAILQVRTGQSEYEARVGQLGHEILRDALHGPLDDFKSCKAHDAVRGKRLQREELRKHDNS